MPTANTPLRGANTPLQGTNTPRACVDITIYGCSTSAVRDAVNRALPVELARQGLLW